MSSTVSLSETQIFTALRSVLTSFGLVPATVGAQLPILRGQANRVPEPANTDYVEMWPLSRDRLATNIDVVTDVQVTGSITSNVLTVTQVLVGSVGVGLGIFGPGVTLGCVVTQQLTGTPGGIGTYSVTPTANFPA